MCEKADNDCLAPCFVQRGMPSDGGRNFFSPRPRGHIPVRTFLALKNLIHLKNHLCYASYNRSEKLLAVHWLHLVKWLIMDLYLATPGSLHNNRINLVYHIYNAIQK
jgi:hypothetical protein